MRYSDYKCDGCEKVFNSDDDIVVCPECATPQHRECYDKNGGCVNSHLHSEDFQWQGEKVPHTEISADDATERETQTEEPLICPNCKHENPHGSTFCENCGMKFTLFGFNLAQAVQDEQVQENAPLDPSITPKMTPPDYPPPFTLDGEDEAESKEENRLPANSEEQMEQFLAHTISNSTGYNVENENGGEGLFKGPYPDDMKIDGIPANTMGAFIARNAERYIEKFRRLSSGGKLSFNWAAFFFSPYWFFYRKLYKPGIIFMTVTLCLNVLATPAAAKYMDFYNNFLQTDFASMSEAAIMEAMNELTAMSMPMFIFAGVIFVLRLIAGFVANPLYKKYTVNCLKEVENEPNRNQKLTQILKYGGVAPLMALAALMAEEIISMIAANFF